MSGTLLGACCVWILGSRDGGVRGGPHPTYALPTLSSWGLPSGLLQSPFPSSWLPEPRQLGEGGSRLKEGLGAPPLLQASQKAAQKIREGGLGRR